MARKQTRRSVSLNVAVYHAAAKVAARQGKTLSALTTEALRGFGVIAPETHHTPVEIAQKAMAHKRPIEAVPGKLQVKIVESFTRRRRPGPIRKALGDGAANALGEPLWIEKRRVS